MQLEGKSIVVMGAGSGVGRGRRRCASPRRAPRSSSPTSTSTRAKETVQLIEEAGGAAIADQCDVAQEADVEATHRAGGRRASGASTSSSTTSASRRRGPA